MCNAPRFSALPPSHNSASDPAAPPAPRASSSKGVCATICGCQTLTSSAMTSSGNMGGTQTLGVSWGMAQGSCFFPPEGFWSAADNSADSTARWRQTRQKGLTTSSIRTLSPKVGGKSAPHRGCRSDGRANTRCGQRVNRFRLERAGLSARTALHRVQHLLHVPTVRASPGGERDHTCGQPDLAGVDPARNSRPRAANGARTAQIMAHAVAPRPPCSQTCISQAFSTCAEWPAIHGVACAQWQEGWGCRGGGGSSKGSL